MLTEKCCCLREYIVTQTPRQCTVEKIEHLQESLAWTLNQIGEFKEQLWSCIDGKEGWSWEALSTFEAVQSWGRVALALCASSFLPSLLPPFSSSRLSCYLSVFLRFPHSSEIYTSLNGCPRVVHCLFLIYRPVAWIRGLQRHFPAGMFVIFLIAIVASP